LLFSINYYSTYLLKIKQFKTNFRLPQKKFAKTTELA